MPKFETVKAGDRLYEVRRTKGTAKFRGKWDVWGVVVKEVDAMNRRALVSWNGNTPQWVSAGTVEKYRRTPPEVKPKGNR